MIEEDNEQLQNEIGIPKRDPKRDGYHFLQPSYNFITSC
jgi:hypothetical protein